jgi:3-oxoacyl-[acyl-carrier-protein] synthase II
MSTKEAIQPTAEFEGLDEPLLAQLPTFELFFKTFGFKRIHGRVWGLLVLAGQALSSREISRELGLSQGATSTALNELTAWGAIKSEFDTQRRCHLHAPVGNTLSIVATVFRRREQVVFGKFKQAAQGTLEYIRSRYGEKDPRVFTLRSIISSLEIAEAVMQLVFSSVERALGDSESILSRAVNTALKVGFKVPSRLIANVQAASMAQSQAPGESLPTRSVATLLEEQSEDGTTSWRWNDVPDLPRVVITGIGLASPNGDSLEAFRHSLLNRVSGVERWSIRHVGETLAGVCHFDALRYQKRKELRRGTRAGSISIWCANRALEHAGLDTELASGRLDRARTGVYIGTTEHGNVETENQIHEVSQYAFDLSYWSHHHNPRTVANNPAGEVTLNLGLTGPAYAIGAACAAGNLGLIHGMQMLQLGEVDRALCGGVSESIHTFGIFASFKAQGALASHADPTKASRPFDRDRNGIVVAEGGALYVLERLSDARARGARILGEIVGHHVNSDASDFVLPLAERQNECMRGALARAGIGPGDVQIVSSHATATPQGDQQECEALRAVFGDSPATFVNNTKSFIGHAMGAAGALELAGNLPAFVDGYVHPTINVDNLDPACEVRNLVVGEPRRIGRVDHILNLSFGMLGINSAVVVRSPELAA